MNGTYIGINKETGNPRVIIKIEGEKATVVRDLTKPQHDNLLDRLRKNKELWTKHIAADEKTKEQK